MITRFCTDVIFASVLVMMFFTNTRVALQTSGHACYDLKQLTILAISNNTLAFIELTLIFLMHQSNQSSMLMIALNILLAIAFVMINLFLTFVIEPAKVENVLDQNQQTQYQKRSLVAKTVNELLLMTNKNH